MARDIDIIVRKARSQGWTVDHTRGGHLRFINPSGERYTTGSTPSDVYGIRNLIADLKRRGLVYDRGRGRRRPRRKRN